MRPIAKFLEVVGILRILGLRRIEAQESSHVGMAATAEAAQKFLGTWTGMMESPVGDPFPVSIHLEEFQYGKWCGKLEHAAPLDADGNFLGVEVKGKTMHLAQTVFRGRERCLDGLNVLTLIDDNTIERVWVDPDTGKPRDKGRLSRQGHDHKCSADSHGSAIFMSYPSAWVNSIIQEFRQFSDVLEFARTAMENAKIPSVTVGTQNVMGQTSTVNALIWPVYHFGYPVPGSGLGTEAPSTYIMVFFAAGDDAQSVLNDLMAEWKKIPTR